MIEACGIQSLGADMLAEFEEYAESKRYMHCLKLAQFAEWREWDNVMAQDREWNKLIQSRDDTILSFQLGALEDTLPTPSIRKLWYGTKVDATWGLEANFPKK